MNCISNWQTLCHKQSLLTLFYIAISCSYPDTKRNLAKVKSWGNSLKASGSNYPTSINPLLTSIKGGTKNAGDTWKPTWWLIQAHGTRYPHHIINEQTGLQAGTALCGRLKIGINDLDPL